ncbi:GntR family transcriptional regulator [Acuticoccus sediminis]|nr:GntR family transcriptional regulator [Acuticoccus sediminis]
MTRRPRDPTAPQIRAENIYQTLRNRICTNRIPPDTLLREEVLAAEFNVSRSPIRKVLAKLEHEGLVEVRHGVGTHVTQIDADALVDIYRARMSIAAATGPYFVTPLTAAHADMVDTYRDRFRALTPGDANGFADVNLQFYRDLTGLIANTCMREVHRNLFYGTSRMWLMKLPELDWADTIAKVCDELDEITRAIRRSDPMALGYAMRNGIAFNLSQFQLAREFGEPE